MKYYFIIFITCLIIFLKISHTINNKIINDEMKIQQVEHPDINMINILQKNKLPTIYLYELELWEGIDLLIGENYETIKDVMENKDVLENIKYYLKPYKLPMSLGWKNLELIKCSTNWGEKLSIKPIKQENYNNFIVNFSGLLMVCLINPTAENMEIINNENNIKNLLDNEENSKKLEYIIIPIRPSNMIYIPYGWYYWLYNGVDNSYTCYLNCVN